MRNILIILVIFLLIGCSKESDNPIMQIIPDSIGIKVAGAVDLYPVVYGTDEDADAKDEVYIAAMDSTASTYSRVQIGTDDFKQGQWVAQRNTVVYMTDGQYGVVILEDTSLDLELWMAPQAGWDISGTWTMIDDEATGSEFIDSVCYQNGIHAFTGEQTGAAIYPDGAGVWVEYGGSGSTSVGVSIVRDRHLIGWFVGYGADGVFVIAHDYITTKPTVDFRGYYGIIETNDQIITDDSDCIWLFDPATPALGVAAFDDIYSIMLESDAMLLVGTQTGSTSATILIDSTARFINDGAVVGSIVENTDTGQSALVVSVDSQIQITTAAVSGSWNNGDAYQITTPLNPILETVATVTGTAAALIDYDVVCNFTDNTIHAVTLEYNTTPGETLGTSYSIVTAAPNTLFIVSGDATVEISGGDTIRVSGSTGNDGDYTVSSAVYNAGPITTDITINETFGDSTGDGIIREVTAFTNYNYELNYYRRDFAGWSDSTTVDSWALTVGADSTLQTAQGFPQITVDSLNNLVIYYNEIVSSSGDLRKWALPSADYFTYSTTADWDQTTNIDNTSDDILWCLTIGNHPEI